MKKIVRLNESDLIRIVKRVLKENLESRPNMIRVRLTPELVETMMEKNNFGGIDFNTEMDLISGMWYKIGQGRGNFHSQNYEPQSFFFSKYKPNQNEIYTMEVRCKGRVHTDMAKQLTLMFDERFNNFLSSENPYDRCYDAGGFYSKFETRDGKPNFDVGEQDHRGYFEITKTSD